ncbi:serine hydrolase [Nibribacter ruber]|uniref:Serine hydrolase n=1 Tax=Nibribacter ruber TaxID=2698458 RepID=A0A6P1NUD8_9BACT|nr:serine hydrolase domain-containing protein [Nibribacter ruber]QHL85934.1 serine hydrolase [Nibribacter ruber]
MKAPLLFLRLSAFVFISLMGLSSYGQDSHNQALTKSLEKLQKSSGYVGFSVAVVNKDGVLYQNAFGHADLKNKQPYTTGTVQNIASVSKTVIGVALMKAVELGYFTLDTPINDILPWAVTNPETHAPILVKHLATHTSGILDREEVYGKIFTFNTFSDSSAPLYNWMKKEAVLTNRTDTTLASFLKEYVTANGQHYSVKNFTSAGPGTTYAYSNIGSALAAYLIEVKAGMPFSAFCKKHIFKPLGMQQTAWFLTPDLAQASSKNYSYKKKAYPLYSEITYPDGSLHTNLQDLSRFLQEMIKGFQGTGTLLPGTAYAQLFQKQFSEENAPQDIKASEPNSGIFWAHRKNGQIGHTGGDLGVTTLLYFDPATGIGKIFMANTELDNPSTGKVNQKLAEHLTAIWKALDAVKE